MPVNDVFGRTGWAVVITRSILYPSIWQWVLQGCFWQGAEGLAELPASACTTQEKAQADCTRRVINCDLRSMAFRKANTSLLRSKKYSHKNRRSGSSIWAGWKWLEEADHENGFLTVESCSFFLLSHGFPGGVQERSRKQARAVIPSGVTNRWAVPLQQAWLQTPGRRQSRSFVRMPSTLPEGRRTGTEIAQSELWC